MTFKDVSFGADGGLVFEGSIYRYATIDEAETARSISSSLYFEAVFRHDVGSANMVLFRGPDNGRAFGYAGSYKTYYCSTANKPRPDGNIAVSSISHVAVGYDGTGADSSYPLFVLNGVQRGFSATSNWGGSSSVTYVGKRTTGNPFFGSLYALLFYDRIPTDAERSSNFTAAQKRYGVA